MSSSARGLAVACLGILAFAVASAAPAAPRNDYLLVLDQRAGPYRYLDGFKKGKPDAYEAALAAFGQPTRSRAEGNYCRVTWAKAGVTIGFASRPRPCAQVNLESSAWYGMSLHGPSWHNRVGVHVGDGVEKVRSLYPNARFESPLGTRWLVLLRRRVDEFDFIRLAVAVDRRGRVTSIEVPAGYVY